MRTLFGFLAVAGFLTAQVVVPEGTRLRVRLDQSLSSATAEQGQAVELSVTEAVKAGDQVVIPEGARVTGTITDAQEKRRMGRAGKLDFSIDRVRAVDGEWIPLRYTVNKKSGGSHAVSTGVITAGAAVLFDTFTDQDHGLKSVVAVTSSVLPLRGAPGAAGSAAVTITADKSGADIEVDGQFVGNTPTTIQLASGPHQVTVRSESGMWQRNLQVSPGSTITLNAQVAKQHQAMRSAR
jgi:hypothetical protein